MPHGVRALAREEGDAMDEPVPEPTDDEPTPDLYPPVGEPAETERADIEPTVPPLDERL